MESSSAALLSFKCHSEDHRAALQRQPVFASPLPSLQPCVSSPCFAGDYSWLSGHTVAGVFALQVRRMMLGWWFVLLGGFSIWNKPRDFICEQGEGKQKSEQL